jgi:FkbM family methyltransferase
MKKIIKCIIEIFAKNLISLFTRFNSGRFFLDQVSKNIFTKKKHVKHNNLEFNFYTPNRINYFRAETFSTKEPETLRWIDTFKKNSVFWDIGANVGLYSCYAAKKIECKVYAFEPSVFNLELLSKNIFINSLMDKIIIIPFPVTNKLGINTFNMSSTEWGDALSTFGENISKEQQNKLNIFKYNTVGMSMNDCVKLLKLKKPNYIKIDVDGIEDLILKDSRSILESAESILVEVDNSFEKQAKNIEKYLLDAGFHLKETQYSQLGYKNLLNQIWVK